MVCRKCNKVVHIAKDCRSYPLVAAQATHGNEWKANVTCFGCGRKGHYKSECREPWNRGNARNGGNHGNRCAGGNGHNQGNRGAEASQGNQGTGNQHLDVGAAQGRVYALGKEIKEDLNVVIGTILLNNRYASILFDTGVIVL